MNAEEERQLREIMDEITADERQQARDAFKWRILCDMMDVLRGVDE